MTIGFVMIYWDVPNIPQTLVRRVVTKIHCMMVWNIRSLWFHAIETEFKLGSCVLLFSAHIWDLSV